MNNYVTCFRLLTHLGVNNIWADYANALLLGTNSRKKRNVDTLDSAHQSKKAVQLWQWLVWTTTEWCTLLLLNFLNLRDLFGIWRKLKESIFKNSNQINSTVTTRTLIFLKGWTRVSPSTRLVCKWKSCAGPRLLKCSIFDVGCCSSECMAVASH